MKELENIFIPLAANQNEEELSKSIESLNFILKSAGANAQVVTNKEYDMKLLHISCRVEDYSQKAKRHAGRPEVFAEKMTVGEALDLRATHTMDEIAEMAGTSKRTLYRKLQKYKNIPGMTL